MSQVLGLILNFYDFYNFFLDLAWLIVVEYNLSFRSIYKIVSPVEYSRNPVLMVWIKNIRSFFKPINQYGWYGYIRLIKTIRVLLLVFILVWLNLEKEKKIKKGLRRIFYWLANICLRTISINLRNISKHAIWIRNQIVTLGPTFIKIGQTLATRPDIVPLVYIKELTLLQDQVPCFSNMEAWRCIENELGVHPKELFLSIDSVPLAAASLGQVYRARLKNGEEVVIKVQRPNLEKTLQLDLTILRIITKFIQRLGYLENIDCLEIINEFEGMIYQEIDYEKEIKNAEQFRENFINWKNTVYIPKIYPEFSSSRVITMEYIDGLKIINLDELQLQKHNPTEIIQLLIQTYLKQLLEDGFFHADPHPGNLRVMPGGKLAFFDFGMVGKITENMRSGMIDAFFHILEKDIVGLVEDAIQLEFLRPGYDPEEFKPIVQGIFEKYIGRKISTICFRDLVYAISETMYSLPFRIPAHFTFIIRALVTIEGIGLAVDPQFSFFNTARPYAKEFMLKKESTYLRNQMINKLIRGNEGEIEWNKVWNLAKLAYRTYLRR